MMILNLTRGKSSMRVPLRLPATPADIGAAYSKLDEISLEAMQTRIASVVSEIGFLDRYLRDRMMTRPGDYYDLNALADKMDKMDEQQLRTLDGALNAESINGITDILHIADSLKDYIFISGVTTEKELGRFLVDSGYKGFPESVQPYLDYAAIGIEYHAEHDGAFTGDGYTLRRSSAEPLFAEQNNKPIFRVQLQTVGMRQLGHEPVTLDLPASDDKLQYVKNSLNIESFEEVAIIKAECCVTPFQAYLPLQNPDFAYLSELADSMAVVMEDADEQKLLAVLAAKRPPTLREALDIVVRLDAYELVHCGTEEYGRDALMELCGDQNIINTVDGFMDWDAFGSHMMEEDGVTFTEFGAVRKIEPPQPTMGMQMMGY